MLHDGLRFVLLGVIARVLVPLLLLFRVRGRDRLPREGPFILIANHNSHLDTVVLMTMLPLRALSRTRPAAAADYFLAGGGFRAWFATRILGVIAVDRAGAGTPKEKLAPCAEALARGDIVILFPEGSRGAPDVRIPFKSGIGHLAELCPSVPVVPVFLRGLDRVLPSGRTLPWLAPCAAAVGAPRLFSGERRGFVASLERDIDALADEAPTLPFPEVANARH